jgi:hypothetical protein
MKYRTVCMAGCLAEGAAVSWLMADIE